MKKAILSLLILLFIGFSVIAQREIISENVDEYDVYKSQKYGVNGTHFVYNYIVFHFFTPSPYGQQIGIVYGASNKFTYGVKYKLRIFNWLATGTDFNIHFQKYVFSDSFRYSPLANEKVSEKINLTNIGTEFYIRFNIGKHGNSMGKYFDLGVFGSYNLLNKHVISIKNVNTPFYQSKNQEISNKNLNYISDIQYGGILRFAYDKYAFVAKYRISDAFIESFKYPDLARFSVGFEYAMF